MFAPVVSRIVCPALAPVLIVAALALALAQPALATDYCVAPNDICGGVKLQDFQAALDAAAGDIAPDRIFLGATTYTASSQGFIYDPLGGGPVEIVGAGRNATTLAGTSGAFRTLAVFGGSATSVHDLRVVMPPDAPDGAQAFRTNGVAKNVSVTEEAGQPNKERTGVVLLGSGTFENSLVSVSPDQPTTGVQILGGGSVLDSDVYARRGITTGGGTIDRAYVAAGMAGIDVEHGSTEITSTRISSSVDGSVGIAAEGVDGDASVDVDGATIVGPGDVKWGTGMDTTNIYVPASSVNIVMKNTIIRNYPASLWVDGYGPGHVNVNISYSDYDSSTKNVPGPGATLTEANNSYIGNTGFSAKGFVPLAGSPLIDAGDPSEPQGLDALGNTLVTDGDGDGNARRDIGAVELATQPLKPGSPAPPSGGGGVLPGGNVRAVPPVDTLAPSLSDLRMSRKVFAVGRAKTAIAARSARGTRISYKLSESAKVVVKIQRVGSKRGAGQLVRTARSGLNRIAFSGRIGKKALKPGRYSLTIRATDAAGNRSVQKSIRFRVATR